MIFFQFASPVPLEMCEVQAAMWDLIVQAANTFVCIRPERFRVRMSGGQYQTFVRIESLALFSR